MIDILYSENLFSKSRNLIKSGIGYYTVHEDKALAVFHVQISHRCKLFLEETKRGKKVTALGKNDARNPAAEPQTLAYCAGSIKNFEHINFIINFNLLLI